MLTNEAPLKYLLSIYPKINEIICLVSKEANTPPKWNPEKFKDETEDNFLKQTRKGLSPYAYLKAQISDYTETLSKNGFREKEIKFTPIKYENSDDKCFSDTIYPTILKNVNPEDKIFLETTGGSRYNVIQMMFLTRILAYQETKLICAVYSDFQSKKIFDVTDSYRDFNLLNGMNEFRSTSETGMLMEYFTDKAAKELIEAMKNLTETIMLANISKIEERKSKVKELLDNAENKASGNSKLAFLLPIFKHKYSQISTTPDLIKWCASNKLIQLAFTLYADWIPHYIMAEKGIITLKGKLSKEEKDKIEKSQFNTSSYLLKNTFINQIEIFLPLKEFDNRQTSDGYVKVIEQLDELRKDSRKLEKLDRKIKELESLGNQDDELERCKQLFKKTAERWTIRRKCENLRKQIKKMESKGKTGDKLDSLKKQLEKFENLLKKRNTKKKPGQQNTDGEEDIKYFSYKETIKSEEMQKMLLDYAYAVTIRNKMNHASSNAADSKTSNVDGQKKEQKKVSREEYLTHYGYEFEINIEILTKFLNDAMEHIESLA